MDIIALMTEAGNDAIALREAAEAVYLDAWGPRLARALGVSSTHVYRMLNSADDFPEEFRERVARWVRSEPGRVRTALMPLSERVRSWNRRNPPRVS